jgi:hypothetical protein
VNLDDFQVGVLFKWHNFPFQHDEIVKDRYFIYLGCPNRMITPQIEYFLVTGTSLTQYYEPNRERHNSQHIRFNANEHNLPLDTVFDIDIGFDHFPEDTVSHECRNMEIMSHLCEKELRTLFTCVANSTYITYQVKRDIKSAFEHFGLCNLPAVRQHRRGRYSYG